MADAPEKIDDVLRDSLELYSEFGQPSPSDVLKLQIRAICAQQGYPKPAFDRYPSYDLAKSYMAEVAEARG